MYPTYRYERALNKKGFKFIAGIDEAGRGPLAGPVVAAAVILGIPIPGLNDSKRLSPKERQRLWGLIKKSALAVGLAVVSPKVIDQLNIYQATLLAMCQAVQNLSVQPDYLLVDGKLSLDCNLPQDFIVGGDGKSASIAAASIVAKVHRDQLMLRYHQKYPLYGFDRHKGYGTKLHFAQIALHGPSAIHRRSFNLISRIF